MLKIIMPINLYSAMEIPLIFFKVRLIIDFILLLLNDSFSKQQRNP